MKRQNIFMESIKFPNYPMLTINDIQDNQINKIKTVIKDLKAYVGFCQRKNAEAKARGGSECALLSYFITRKKDNPLWHLALVKTTDGKQCVTLDNYFKKINKCNLKLAIFSMRGKIQLIDIAANRQLLLEIRGIEITDKADKLLRESVLEDYKRSEAAHIDKESLTIQTTYTRLLRLPHPMNKSASLANIMNTIFSEEENKKNEVVIKDESFPSPTPSLLSASHLFRQVKEINLAELDLNKKIDSTSEAEEMNDDVDNVKKTAISFLLN